MQLKSYANPKDRKNAIFMVGASSVQIDPAQPGTEVLVEDRIEMSPDAGSPQRQNYVFKALRVVREARS